MQKTKTNSERIAYHNTLIDEAHEKVNELPQADPPQTTTEQWVFTLTDGTIITKDVIVQ